MKKISTAAWREIGGVRKYFRSLWESNFARYLQWQLERHMIEAWEHEPETFWFEGIKRGVNNYKPDFRVLNAQGLTIYYEVKGYLDSKSKTKLERFKRYFPEIPIFVIDKKWFEANNQTMRLIIPDWEIGKNSFSKNKFVAKKKIYV